MQKIIIIFIILSTGANFSANAQANEITQLLLNVEKLSQLKKILSNMKKGYQILSTGYNTIEDLSKGNFNLHKTFLDGLLEVSPEVREYKKIADIINYQLILVEEYKTAYARFKQDGNFSPEELDYLARVYDQLFKQSLNHLNDLTTVITAGKLRMSDDERLQAIDSIYWDMQDKLLFLRHFNNNTTILAVQRARNNNDVRTIKEIYGLIY
jgi:DNA repair ATPase RecN